MNLVAEKNLLSALISVEDLLHRVPYTLSEVDFQDNKHSKIAKVVLKLLTEVKKPTKELILSTAEELNLNDFKYLTDDGVYLDDIVDRDMSLEEGLTFLAQVKRESIKKVVSTKMTELKKYVEDTPDKVKDIIKRLEDTVLTITSNSDALDNKPIKLLEKLEEHILFLGNNPGLAGLDIGLPEWQLRIGGVCNGMVHMIIATNKAGKSTIGARAAVLQGRHVPVLIIDTEMSEELQMERLFCMHSKVPYTTLRNGFWNKPDHPDFKYKNRIMQAIPDFKASHYKNIEYIKASGRSVKDMLPTMRRWVIENKVSADGKVPRGIIIYDYMKLNSYEELGKFGLQEYQKLGLDAAELKDFANRYKVPIMTFGQTNREDDMTINCLGASKRLADLCDSVSLFKEKTPELKAADPIGSHLMRVFVSRHGPSTSYGEHIRLDFDKSCGQILEQGLFTPSVNLTTKRKYTKRDEPSVDEILDEPNNDQPF